MQIRTRIKTAKPDLKNDFEKTLELELLSFSMELAQIINKGIGKDNVRDTWEDLLVPGLAMRTSSSAPDLITFGPSGGLLVYGFDGGATLEQVYFTVQFPHKYKIASAIHPHVHWSPVDTGAGNVEWSLEYSWADRNGTFAAPSIVRAPADDADGVAWKHQIAPFAEIASPRTGMSSIFVGRLFRDPSRDTYTGDAALIHFDIHIQQDALGSESEFVK